LRLRCLFGSHDWQVHRRIEPPREWADMPVFALKRCVHCGTENYDMVWPDGAIT
jgi:hypothetical protein